MIDGGWENLALDDEGCQSCFEATAAPRRWPVIDLVELTGTRAAWSPKTALIATVSTRSPAGVEVRAR